MGPTRRGKGTKIMLLVDAQGVPLAIDTECANRNEVNLIERLIDRRIAAHYHPKRIIYDKAADCDGLRLRLRERQIDLISPHRRTRSSPSLQDGRKLRRYARRWIVERTISWLHNFRRTVVRWEYHAHLFRSFLVLAAITILLKRF